MIGNSGVGKSCLFYRFVDDYFDKIHKELSVDFKIRTINVDEKVYYFQIWDTAGRERSKNMKFT